MQTHVLIVTFVIAFFLHYGVQKLFIYYKRFDNFNNRSTHKTLATRTGGIGIFLSVFFTAVYFYLIQIKLFDYSLFIPLSIMFIVGVYDDLYNADFKLKFLLQVIVAKILIDQGYVISNYHGLFGLYEVPWLLAQVSTVFVFLVVVNAINFIDGIDGLAITEAIKIILLTLFFSSNHLESELLAKLILASTLPLYYFNFKSNNKVFLGDAGSLFLGTFIMILVLTIFRPEFQFTAGLNMNKTLFSVVLLLYPLTDLLRVFIIRIKNKKSPFKPDKNHIHHHALKLTNNHFIVSLSLNVLTTLILLFYVYSSN